MPTRHAQEACLFLEKFWMSRPQQGMTFSAHGCFGGQLFSTDTLSSDWSSAASPEELLENAPVSFKNFPQPSLSVGTYTLHWCELSNFRSEVFLSFIVSLGIQVTFLSVSEWWEVSVEELWTGIHEHYFKSAKRRKLLNALLDFQFVIPSLNYNCFF